MISVVFSLVALFLTDVVDFCAGSYRAIFIHMALNKPWFGFTQTVAKLEVMASNINTEHAQHEPREIHH